MSGTTLGKISERIPNLQIHEVKLSELAKKLFLRQNKLASGNKLLIEKNVEEVIATSVSQVQVDTDQSFCKCKNRSPF